ncbi:MAG: uracil-DNA glycosylase [Clostridia bacterium]|nr:uracil-DNA glycosylase [Clostridia bacterium]
MIDRGRLDELNVRNIARVKEAYLELVRRGKLPDIEPMFVTGNGSGKEPVVLIGEAPGKEEVREGRPFVGPAGKILDELLERSGIERGKLYITNTVKYRLAAFGKRPGTFANRPVKTFEIELCSGWLAGELALIRPKLILTLGNTALRGVLLCLETNIGTCSGIGDVHGKKIGAEVRGTGETVTLMPLYHPASLIYNRELRPQYEHDLEEVKKCAQLIL